MSEWTGWGTVDTFGRQCNVEGYGFVIFGSDVCQDVWRICARCVLTLGHLSVTYMCAG